MAETLKASGKVKMVGFSCHGGPEYIQAAADGGFLDALMVQYTPFYERGGAFDRALTACHEKGIGLIAMKTLRHAGNVPKRLPEFEKLGLTTHQALLQAVWSDPRISAICNSVRNFDQMKSSIASAHGYKAPLEVSLVDRLKDAVLASRRTMCPGCPSCDAMVASTAFAFRDVARYVTYFEQDNYGQSPTSTWRSPGSARDVVDGRPRSPSRWLRVRDRLSRDCCKGGGQLLRLTFESIWQRRSNARATAGSLVLQIFWPPRRRERQAEVLGKLVFQNVHRAVCRHDDRRGAGRERNEVAMAPRMPETLKDFAKRFRAAAKAGETQIRFGRHHYSHAIVLEDGVWRVRGLVLDDAKVEAYRAQHRTFMPEHAEMLSEPGPIVVFEGTIDEVLAKLPKISAELNRPTLTAKLVGTPRLAGSK